MKYFIRTIAIILIYGGIAFIPAKAQIDEIGFGLGGLSYTGDLVRGYKLLQNKPAGTFFIRHNINDYVSLRYAATGGILSGGDANNPIDPFAVQRSASFRITIVELSIMMEYHFLDFKTGSALTRFSPYFTGGIALFGMSGSTEKPKPYSSFQPAIPLGLGLKYIVNPKWMVGFEFGLRKLFIDWLDNVSEGDPLKKNYQYGNWYDNDTYYFTGFTLNYAFYRIPCPFPYQ